MTAGARKGLLFAALAITLILVFTGGEDEVSTPRQEVRSAPVARRTNPPARAEPAPPINSAALAREALDIDAVNIFAAKSWYIPPPPPKALPPPPPSAPPLPFAYLGRLEEGGVTTIFLSRQGNNYSVRKGDSIDSTYRVEDITPGAVTFTYLPLNTRQMLPIGGAN